MVRWQLILLRVDPIMGNFDCSEITQEERRKERSFGYKVPWNNSSSLEASEEMDLAEHAKVVFEAFGLKDVMEVSGAESVNIFCRSPYTNISLKLDEEGTIKIGSDVSFAFTQEQFENLLAFAEALKSRGLLYQE